MIEMLGVLAIVGVLSAGGIAGYSMAMQTYKTNLLIERIQLLSSRVRTIYKSGGFAGLTNASLINSGKVNSKDLENPFGGNLTVQYGNKLGTNYFYIMTYGSTVPADTCVDLLMTYWGDENIFWGMGAKTGAGIAATNIQFLSDQTKKPYPASLADATEACGNTDTTVLFYFK